MLSAERRVAINMFVLLCYVPFAQWLTQRDVNTFVLPSAPMSLTKEQAVLSTAESLVKSAAERANSVSPWLPSAPLSAC